MVCSRFCQAEVAVLSRTGSNGPEGPNCCINSFRIDVFLDHEPQPTTTKNLIHLSQMIKTGKIAKYDYGDQGQNMKHYGQPVPLTYDMTQIPNELPLFLSYGGRDMLFDVKKLNFTLCIKLIPTVINFILVLLYLEILGPNCCINSSRIDVFLDHEPQPIATKNLIHLSQVVKM